MKDDSISRRAAIDALSHMMDTDGFRDGWAVSRANVDCMLRSLPSAQSNLQPTCNQLATDCISRQKAIDALDKKFDDVPMELTTEILKLRRDLRELPSAQPEIIRCKDCKHYQFANNRAFGTPVKMCKWLGFEDFDDDDFCSQAERRTDD